MDGEGALLAGLRHPGLGGAWHHVSHGSGRPRRGGAEWDGSAPWPSAGAESAACPEGAARGCGPIRRSPRDQLPAASGPPCSPKPLPPGGGLRLPGLSPSDFSVCPSELLCAHFRTVSRFRIPNLGIGFALGSWNAHVVFSLPVAPLLGCVFNTCSLLPLACGIRRPPNSLLLGSFHSQQR